MCSHFAARTKLSTLQLLLPAPYSLQCLLSQPRPFKPLLRAHTLAAPLSFRSSATLPFTPFLNLFLGLFIEQEALLMTLRHTMLPSPAEQRQLLIMSLERMPSADHEMFLGTMIYPLVQVRILSIPSPIVLSILYFATHPVESACSGGGSGTSRKSHRHAARARRVRDY